MDQHQTCNGKLCLIKLFSVAINSANEVTVLLLILFFLQAVPPLEVTDLIEEIRDGHVLLSLLEVLLGTTLVRPVY